MNVILGPVGRFFFERQAKGKSGTELSRILEESRQTLLTRFKNAPQTEQNHRVITHIIGIEKWSQQRAQVAQGGAFREEEYDVYRPPRNTSWDDLMSIFEQTRQVSITLARNLNAPQLTQKIRHNMYGEISAGAWLIYMYTHSNLESRRLR